MGLPLFLFPTNGSWQQYKKYGKISRRAKILLIIHDKSVLHSYGAFSLGKNRAKSHFGAFSATKA